MSYHMYFYDQTLMITSSLPERNVNHRTIATLTLDPKGFNRHQIRKAAKCCCDTLFVFICMQEHNKLFGTLNLVKSFVQ